MAAVYHGFGTLQPNKRNPGPSPLPAAQAGGMTRGRGLGTGNWALGKGDLARRREDAKGGLSYK